MNRNQDDLITHYGPSKSLTIFMGPTSASFIIYFRSFQINILTIFTIHVKNLAYGAVILTHDLLDVSLLPYDQGSSTIRAILKIIDRLQSGNLQFLS